MVKFKNPADLVQFLKAARAEGVTRLRLGELEVELLPLPLPPPKPGEAKPDPDDELLMHSAGG